MARIVEGGRVRVGERELVVPKASLKVAREAESILARISSGEAAVGVQLDLLLALLKPATPDLTLQEIEEGVLLEELEGTIKTVLEAAGFRARPPGEAVGP